MTVTSEATDPILCVNWNMVLALSKRMLFDAM